MLIEVTCPKCGGEIVGCDSVPANASIAGWERDEVDGFTPVWSGESDVIWDGQCPNDPQRPYGCTTCGEGFSADDLDPNKRGEG